MTGRHREPEPDLVVDPEPITEPIAAVVDGPPPHPSWWTRRRRLAAGAAAVTVVVVVVAFAVAPHAEPPGRQLLTAEQPDEPTGRASGLRTVPAPEPEYPPVEIPVIGADGAYDPETAERTPADCGRCDDRAVPEATSAPAEAQDPPVRDEQPDASPEQPQQEAAPAPAAALGLLELVNRDRLANGCGPVAADPDLMAQAQAHAERQAADDSMYHSDGVTGFDTWGENVASGYETAAAVHQAWMESSGHRDNVLNCEFTVIGFGAADGPSGRYWTEQFAA